MSAPHFRTTVMMEYEALDLRSRAVCVARGARPLIGPSTLVHADIHTPRAERYPHAAPWAHHRPQATLG
eukprot:5460003-Prymnesium_polylepis.2